MSLCLFGDCCEGSNDDDDRSILDVTQDGEIPVKQRKKTDFSWFIILVLIFLLMVICVGIAGGQGDIRRLMYASDYKGNVCGFKNKPIDGIDGSGVDQTGKNFLEFRYNCFAGDKCLADYRCVKSCSDGNEPSISSHCNTKGETNDLKALKSILEMIVSDLILFWREILALCFCSIFLSGMVLTVLRMYAKMVIKVVLVVVSLAALGCTILSWVMYSSNSSSDPSLDDSVKRSQGTVDVNWLVAACFFTASTVLFFVSLFVLRHKLKWIAVLFEEGGKCIKDIPTMLLQPVLTYLTTAVFVCFVCIGFVFLQSPTKAEIDEEGRVAFSGNTFFKGISWILLFVFLWLSQFILACQHLVVAGAVSSWYFSRVKGQLSNPVWNSFCMIVKHHLGSAAFGSLLIALIKAFRIFAKMMERRSGRNLIAFLIWSLLQCLLACIESFLRIINKTAYIMIVLFGEPFCRSARKAFACITSDSSHIALLIGAETFILTVIELLITVCVTLVGATLFTNNSGLQSFWIPTSAVFILSYLCCNCFFSVYSMTVDSLILCLCVDHQMNDGLENPYYMNNNLKILLNDYSVTVKAMAPEQSSNDSPMLNIA